tara:strand:- start:446 stop:1633 length:1188 start_codon:yes stop_codon:yes gene_type:complete
MTKTALAKKGAIKLLELKKIIGVSPPVKDLRELIKLLGPSDSTVLIVGESGTGKELIANALHGCSGRSAGPFVPVNCGAIPRDLLESELFGHKKGSFTGAISDRKGRFQLAHKGTLFLDEIGDMSMDLQVKLLRVLQERTVDPVGSSDSISIDVRVIAATHQNIEALIDEGKFRKDLYYRLNIMPIEAVPLRERAGDIPLLIEHFSKQQAKVLQAPISIYPASMKLLLAYDWPGNVRELSNLVDRYTALYAQQEVDLRLVPASMVPSGLRKLMQGKESQNRTLSEDESSRRAVKQLDHVTADLFDRPASSPDRIDLPIGDSDIDEIQRVINLAQGGPEFPDEGLELKQHLLEIERRLIKQALSKSEGNVSKTARLLSLRRTTLIEKINKHGMHSV